MLIKKLIAALKAVFTAFMTAKKAVFIAFQTVIQKSRNPATWFQTYTMDATRAVIAMMIKPMGLADITTLSAACAIAHPLVTKDTRVIASWYALSPITTAAMAMPTGIRISRNLTMKSHIDFAAGMTWFVMTSPTNFRAGPNVAARNRATVVTIGSTLPPTMLTKAI